MQFLLHAQSAQHTETALSSACPSGTHLGNGARVDGEALHCSSIRQGGLVTHARAPARCLPAVRALFFGQAHQRQQHAGIGQPRRHARRDAAQGGKRDEDGPHALWRVWDIGPGVVCAKPTL